VCTVLCLCATGKKKATANSNTYSSSDMTEAEFDITSTAAAGTSTAVDGSKKRKAALSRGSSPARSDNGKHNCFCNVKYNVNS
jgi:hypothetical protein